jgi:hypothetical protein
MNILQRKYRNCIKENSHKIILLIYKHVHNAILNFRDDALQGRQ